MMFRVISAASVLLGLAIFMSAAVSAQDKDNIHTGKFVSATGKSFKMEDKAGKEHTHTLANDAKVLGEDGKEARLSDFRKGQMLRVTTREGDKTTATRVEAIKDNGK
jgi:hypothetical protein